MQTSYSLEVRSRHEMTKRSYTWEPRTLILNCHLKCHWLIPKNLAMGLFELSQQLSTDLFQRLISLHNTSSLWSPLMFISCSTLKNACVTGSTGSSITEKFRSASLSFSCNAIFATHLVIFALLDNLYDRYEHEHLEVVDNLSTEMQHMPH